MSNFEYKGLIEKRKMSIENLKKYYKELRKYECENNIPVKGIEIRKKIYKLIQIILKIDRILNKRTLTIVGDERVPTNKTKIYAATHIGRYDIESAIEATGEATWFIMGDPGETYRNIDGLLLRAHGVSWFDMDDKYDAHTVNERQKQILKSGGNELCFPEAAWNIDPLLPVMDIHPGIVKRAIKTNSVIIPMAIEQYYRNGKLNYYVNIGEVLDYTDSDISKSKEIAEEIRIHMATLRWEIWEKYGQASRKDLLSDWENSYEEFIEGIMKDSENGYTIEEIEKTRYKDPTKPVFIDPTEVFSHYEQLEISRETAFLAKDIIKSKKLTK